MNFQKDKMSRINAHSRVNTLIKYGRELKASKKELDEKFSRLEKEKADMHVKFETAVD